jgi:hypothetical protein
MSEATPSEEKEHVGAAVPSYLQKALAVLKKFEILGGKPQPPELLKLLDEVQHVDETRVLAIARTIQHMSEFNALVRDNVEDVKIGNRYIEITQMFDSIREDSKRLIAQLADGKFSVSERAQNLWMNIRRGSPHSRFEEIADLFRDVTKDTNDQLERERAIMDGYIDFRFALKESETVAHELVEIQEATLEATRQQLAAAQQVIDELGDDADESQVTPLELKRDEARRAFEIEDRNFQLLKDIAENLSIGYDVGETLITKLKQTHDCKDRVYRRSVTFFTTNEHVFTILATVYTSQHGLHEATQAQEALQDGASRGLEDVAELGRELERAALRAGYGSTIRSESVEKLVQAISDFQVESLNMIADLRKESEANAQSIRTVVEAGKRKYREALVRHAIDPA